MGKVREGDKVVCLRHYPENTSKSRKEWGKKLKIGGIYTIRASFEGALSGTDVYLLLEFSGNKGFMSDLFSEKITETNFILGYENFVLLDLKGNLFMFDGSVHIFSSFESVNKFITERFSTARIKRVQELSKDLQEDIKYAVIKGKVIYD